MKAHVCEVCGYIYDESKTGIPFNDLHDDWYCPDCGSYKEGFELEEVNSDDL